MAEVRANITGIEDIAKALKELPAKMERSVIVAALKEAAKPIRDQAKANVRSVSGELKKSIRTVSVAKKYTVGGGVRVRVMAGNKKAFYAHILEDGAAPHKEPNEFVGRGKTKRKNPAMAFGGKILVSVNHPGIKATNFMTNAFLSKGAEAIKRFGEALGPKLEKSLASFFKRRG